MMTVDDASRFGLGVARCIPGRPSRPPHLDVNGKGFSGERPFSKANIKRFGNATSPDGRLPVVLVSDLNVKKGPLAANPTASFTIRTSTDTRQFSSSW
jgi:hypothetical protein